jgi:type IV pilus assembly protein PilV
MAMTRRNSRGFSLLELMVAVVVFSIGLIGLGLLLTSAIRANHVGFLHSQATFVAESLADRMRANVAGVWLDAYDGTWDATATAPTVTCAAASPCTPTQVALRDVWAWGNMVAQLLPGGQGRVACTPQPGRPLPDVAQLASVPVFNGTCAITLTWNEQSESDTAGAVTGSFTWVVTP